jgi:hypothetical protein
MTNQANTKPQPCAACGKPISGQTHKKMGNFYCSLYCAELMAERLRNLDMNQINFEELGPVVDRFMSTCQICTMPLICRKDRPICGAYFEELHNYITMRWCCHCIYALSCMLSDGSVGLETVKKVLVKAEEIARSNKYIGVSQSVMARAEYELMDDFSYTPAPDNRPEPPKEEHDHYLACMQCDKKFMAECFRLTEDEEKNIPRIRQLLDQYPYCGHMKYEMGGMLMAPGASEEKIKQLIEKTKKIAGEKGCEGGAHRLHYIAVGRSIK